jgi:hypothetical protein
MVTAGRVEWFATFRDEGAPTFSAKTMYLGEENGHANDQ